MADMVGSDKNKKEKLTEVIWKFCDPEVWQQDCTTQHYLLISDLGKSFPIVRSLIRFFSVNHETMGKGGGVMILDSLDARCCRLKIHGTELGFAAAGASWSVQVNREGILVSTVYGISIACWIFVIRVRSRFAIMVVWAGLKWKYPMAKAHVTASH